MWYPVISVTIRIFCCYLLKNMFSYMKELTGLRKYSCNWNYPAVFFCSFLIKMQNLFWQCWFVSAFLQSCSTDLDLSLTPSGTVIKQIGEALPVSCTVSSSRNATLFWLKVRIVGFCCCLHFLSNHPSYFFRL